jgi:signal peptidase I
MQQAAEAAEAAEAAPEPQLWQPSDTAPVQPQLWQPAGARAESAAEEEEPAQEPVTFKRRKKEKLPKGTGGKKNRLVSRGVLLWARDVLIALAIALLILQLVKPTIVRQHSMENTLHPNDYVFVNKQAYRFGDVERGDVVVFRSHLESDDGSEKNLIKRVIGLAGDTVEIHDGVVYVNDEALQEPYIKEGYTAGTMEKVTVPEGTLFLMGDNRQQSKDSRDPEVGFVPEDEVIGKAFFRLYPLKDAGVIH